MPAREALLLAVNMLPAGPQILARLDPLLLEMDTSLEEITALLRRDAALTARIIRIANSVVYNPGDAIASIDEALMRIGFAELYRVTGFAVLAQVSNQHVPLYDITGAQFRENSLLTALIMEALAGFTGVDPRVAYTAGLLRSTGKIALDRSARATRGDAGIEPYSRGPLAEWENAAFSCTNCEAAALVLEAWRFPSPLVEAIRNQYTGGGDVLSGMLNLAAGAAERCGHALPGEHSYWDRAPARMAAIGIDEAACDEAMRSALESFGPVRTALA